MKMRQRFNPAEQCPGKCVRTDEHCELRGGHDGPCFSPPPAYYRYNPHFCVVRGLSEAEEKIMEDLL